MMDQHDALLQYWSVPRAYNVGYADADALKLGVNVFMYAVSR